MRAKKKIVTTRMMGHVCAPPCSTVSKHVDVLSGDIAGACERCRRVAHAIRYLPTRPVTRILPQRRYRDAITPRRSQAKLCHVRSRFAIMNPNPKANRVSRNLKHWWHSNTRAQHSNGGPKAGTS